MGPPSYMRSVVDRNVVMWRVPVHVTCVSLSVYFVSRQQISMKFGHPPMCALDILHIISKRRRTVSRCRS